MDQLTRRARFKRTIVSEIRDCSVNGSTVVF